MAAPSWVITSLLQQKKKGTGKCEKMTRAPPADRIEIHMKFQINLKKKF